ncbi:hypothetical protein [Paenibacillus protaetiae]|uniref:Uncharacterized protein n=1 Tax=Paenibacillus protaetiae TaxID=2509456 RepID=A0A4P6EVC6_9BACL|nr:hypothetical protein [Paenibacillus protaetiae]QAY65619.1 hypothetical protein ET464_03705 [Paenibacillus protaetiae]
MLGTWRWNVMLGIIGPVLTILFSIGRNPLPVIGMRSGYAFVAFFLLAYVLRFVLAIILKPADLQDKPAGETAAGMKVDLSTPDESDDLNELLKSGLEAAASGSPGTSREEQQALFKPLNPQKLVMAQNQNPEELAKAVRHLTGR